jgi:peroxiredoxin
MIQIGDSLFNFELKATDGKTYNNYSFADRTALLIIVSCNHCPYARAYWSRLIKLYNKFEDDNLGILVINPNDATQYPDDSFENMVILANELNFPFPYLHDETQEVVKKLGAERTPEAFLFNSKRKLLYKGAIDDSWENEQMVTRIYLEDAIEYTLDGMEPDFQEVPAVGCSIKWKK